MQSMFIHKKHGDMLLSAVLSALVFIMLAGSFFTLFSGQFTRIQAGRTAMQAEQYAEIDTNTLRLLSYDDLDSKGAHARQGITSVADADGWQDEIVVGAEKTIDVTTESKQRIATIKIYKTGDTLSRYSLQVPLSSQGSGGISKGIITAWSGSIANIPSGWYLCDGTNGTPDLRDKFIIGAGNSYPVGSYGGSNTVVLQTSNLPSSGLSALSNYYVASWAGLIKSNRNQGTYFGSPNTTYSVSSWADEPQADTSGGGEHGNQSSFATNLKTNFIDLQSALTITGWNNTAIDTTPPYYSLAYIMKS